MSGEAETFLEMSDISKRFGATVALEDVNLQVRPGEVHALVGENGAGKSTLMKILSGVLSADAGSMKLFGQPYRPANPLEARKLGVAMIYQELSLAPHLSVEENILLGMEPTKSGFMKWGQIRETARSAMERLGHPEVDPSATVAGLSVGIQQLVEIGRAIAVGCRILVFDEPTSSLAHEDVEKLFELIERLKADGHAIVYISHFIEEIKRISDRLTVLRDGRVVGTRETAGVSADEIVSMMVGREVEDLYPRSERRAGDVALEISGLGGEEKPSNASLTLRYGEVVGIAGLVGSGRTEFLRCVFGLDAVKTGQVKVASYCGPSSPARRWAQGVGYLSENRKEEGLALNLSIADNATLSNLNGFGPMGLVLPAHQNRAMRNWIDRLEIKCQGPTQPVESLSGGNQQKVAVARMLQHDVDVLLLDEPTRGIDVGSKALIYQLIDALVTGEGGRKPRAILLVSSYLPELMGICDRIAVMCRGKLGPARPVSERTDHEILMEATGVGDAGNNSARPVE